MELHEYKTSIIRGGCHSGRSSACLTNLPNLTVVFCGVRRSSSCAVTCFCQFQCCLYSLVKQLRGQR